ncbi:MAG: hypothetical protein R3B82_16695 [Sandaracinaceae bacterium]
MTLVVQTAPGRDCASTGVDALPYELRIRSLSRAARARLAARLGGTVDRRGRIHARARNGSIVVPPDGRGYATVTVLGQTFRPRRSRRRIERALRALVRLRAHQAFALYQRRIRALRARARAAVVRIREVVAQFRAKTITLGAARRAMRAARRVIRNAVRAGRRVHRRRESATARCLASLARALAVAGYYHGPLGRPDRRALEEALLDFCLTSQPLLPYGHDFAKAAVLDRLMAEVRS